MISDQQTILGRDETVLFDQIAGYYRYCQYSPVSLSPRHLSRSLTSPIS